MKPDEVERLNGLYAKATPAPLHAEKGQNARGRFIDVYGTRAGDDFVASAMTPETARRMLSALHFDLDQNAEFMVALWNAWPEIYRALTAAPVEPCADHGFHEHISSQLSGSVRCGTCGEVVTAKRLLNAALRARIAELEGDAKDAKLGAAIYRACADLPSGWQLCVFLERGAGWVELSDADDVAVDVETNDLPFDQHVTAAIDAALTPPSAGAV